MASFKSTNILVVLILILIIIAATAVDFEIELDVRVGVLNADGYIAFHDNLRQRVANKYIGPQTNRVAVLRRTNENEPRFFDLRLTGAGGSQTTVRFRTGNLYVVGYTMGNTWLELGIEGKDTKHWIPGSHFLGFRGSYKDMAGAAKKPVTAISLTAQKFQTVVKTLATSTKHDERAEGLILVAQMVSEACRYVVLSNAFSTILNSQKPVCLKEWMLVDLEREWGTYSEILLCHNTFPNSYVYQPQTINGKPVKTVDDLRKRLGILLNVEVGKEKCKIPTPIGQNHVEPAVFEA